ncbi:MAG: AI-2E family transporter [Kocuria sp.]|nr:AI-2E family transporter [Kocuria sp.]
MSHRSSGDAALFLDQARAEGDIEVGEPDEGASGVDDREQAGGVEARGMSTSEVLRTDSEDPSELQPPDETPPPVNAPVNSVHVPRFLAITVGIAGLLILLAGLQGAQDIVAPIFLGLNLLIVVYPLQRWLSARMPRIAAAAIALLVVLGALVLFTAMGAWSVAELVNELPHYQDEFARLIDESVGALATLGISTDMVESSLQGVTAGNIMSLVTPILSNVSAIMGLLATLVMGVFFLSMDSATTGRRLTRLAEDRPHIAGAMVDFAQGVRRYWVVTTVFGLIVALLDVLALQIIGVQLIWVWGILAFITNYIPNIGLVLGMIPPAILALLDDGWVAMLAVVAAYSVLNFTVQSVIQPKFTGESVGVTPTMSFLSLMFWYMILGWLGALVALPATLFLKALLVDADPNARWINALISSRKKDYLPQKPDPSGSTPTDDAEPAAGGEHVRQRA